MTGDEGDDADFDAPKIYEPINSYEQLSERLKMFQAQYNELIRGSQLDLVFFKVLIYFYQCFTYIKLVKSVNTSLMECISCLFYIGIYFS